VSDKKLSEKVMVKKCEAKSLIKMFPDRALNFGRLKTLIGENDSSCSE